MKERLIPSLHSQRQQSVNTANTERNEIQIFTKIKHVLLIVHIMNVMIFGTEVQCKRASFVSKRTIVAVNRYFKWEPEMFGHFQLTSIQKERKFPNFLTKRADNHKKQQQTNTLKSG